jgi:hypothetical protein
VPDAGRAFDAAVRGLVAERVFFAGAAFVVAAFAGAAFAAAAFAGAFAVAAFAGALAAAAFAGAAFAGAALRLSGAAFPGAFAWAFAGAAFAGPDPLVLSSARRASSFDTVAEALVTWPCRRTSSARASLRSRSAFAIERTCFAMVPPHADRRLDRRARTIPIVEMMLLED